MAGTGKAHLRDSPDVLLRIEDLVVEFPVGRTGLKVNAVSGISLDVLKGETLGLVGESGCGKSTTGRAIMQLPRPTSGSVQFEGKELTGMQSDAMREARTRMQMIFQDPISSLNPRRKVRQIVMEPLNIWKRGTDADRAKKVDGILEEVGIELCNLKLGIRPRVPYVFFNAEFWEDLRRQLRVMIKQGRAPAWMTDYILFTDDPDEVVAFYRRKLQVL